MITRLSAATTYRRELILRNAKAEFYAALRCLIAVATQPFFRTADCAQ
jgi:hypothetical protein